MTMMLEHKSRKFHGDPLLAAVQKLHISDEKPAPEEQDLSHHAMGHGDPLRHAARGPAHLEPATETPESGSRASFGILGFHTEATEEPADDIPGPPAETPPKLHNHKVLAGRKVEPGRDIDIPPSPEYGSRKTFGVIDFSHDQTVKRSPPTHGRHASVEGIKTPDTPEFSSRKALGVIEFSSSETNVVSKKPNHNRHVSAEGIKAPDTPEFSSRKALGVIDFSLNTELPTSNAAKQDRQPSTNSALDRGEDDRQEPSESPDDPGHGDPLLAEVMHGTTVTTHSNMMTHSKDPGHGGDPLMDAVTHRKRVVIPGSRVSPGRPLEPPETPESNCRKSLGVIDFASPPDNLVPML